MERSMSDDTQVTVTKVISNDGLLRRLSRTLSAASQFQERQTERHTDSRDEYDEKAQVWAMQNELSEVTAQSRLDGEKPRKLGVTWKNLTVRGISADAAINESVGSQFNVPQLVMESRNKIPLKTIIDNSHGCVKPGEMLLVLGRPGAGCTSLLKMLANRRRGYAEVEGEVHWGSMDPTEALQYRGQIVMNTEEELFFPSLTVGQTIDFATRMKVPFHLPSSMSSPEQYQQANRDFLLRSMGIAHTDDTKVGNEFVRGVSGGERKRVSIIETLATRGSVFCWDNSTRGLDASTALEYTRCIRAMTDVIGIACVVTLYQAGNGIYNLFDKVMVLDEGRQVYYGPMSEARPFMEANGFLCSDSANIGDFLTGVTVPTERQIKAGFEDRFPRTAVELRDAYHRTSFYEETLRETDWYKSDEAVTFTQQFKEGVEYEKHKGLPKKSPLTVSLPIQIRAAIKRQYQMIAGDVPTFMIKQVSTLVQALIAGSLFYDAPDNTAGLFVKGGALFFALLYNALMAMSEVTDSFTGRPVLAKHRGFALYHPAAYCLAQIVADLPILFLQVSVFSIVLYFMVGLVSTAGAFFTFWVFIFSVTMSLTAFFRAVGAGFSNFDAASKVSGFAVAAFVMYSGYMIPKPDMKSWFVWIYWIDPMAYGLQGLLANEFKGKILECVGANLIPKGDGYSSTYAACSGVGGALRGATSVTGAQYLDSLGYSEDNIWRNFGIIWAWWALYVAITIFFTSRWTEGSGSSGALLIPRELAKKNQHVLASKTDEEADQSGALTTTKNEEKPASSASSKTQTGLQLQRNTSVFTWKNLTYTVQTPSGPRVLLDNVHGYVKPGMLGALMGSSGAGKTTLLDVLAQRKTDGTINGSIMVDGRPLSVSFQRSAGYCEQLDVHEALSTVREALEFSALLRQSRDTPRAEKLAYVDTIIDLLELHDIENTLVGKTGNGLSVEQRKRLTIGVELVAKPSILIFLDEPTSGLDGSSAYNTVRFLRKLSEAGQAVLVTIHQPSAQLFSQFDTLLLLAKGGKTVYFGEIGDDAATLKEYFARYDAACPDEVNPAEHMIDVVSGTLSKGRDWNQVWLASPEHTAMTAELDRIITDAAAKPPGTIDDGFEFAAPISTQYKLVLNRMNLSLWRNTDYVNNKIVLHIGSALFNAFSFYMIDDSIAGLQGRLFTIFNYVFVAPGVIAQLQPLFIDRRDIFETREKKSKMYDWKAFTVGLIVSEMPYLMVCGVLYFVCWYWTVGFPGDSEKAGGILLVMLLYQFIYTGIGQFIAAYAPNATFASLANPLVLGILISFAGVLVPYDQITTIWRYTLNYVNPFTWLMGSMLVFSSWDAEVNCSQQELAVFDTPNGQTCLEYLQPYLNGSGSGNNLLNPTATSACEVCVYGMGSDYLKTLNITEYSHGWRDVGITALFCISGYALVFGLMKLRTKQTKKAE